MGGLGKPKPQKCKSSTSAPFRSKIGVLGWEPNSLNLELGTFGGGGQLKQQYKVGDVGSRIEGLGIVGS